MNRMSLIHFQPLELYPPVMNFVGCKTTTATGPELDVYTTWCTAGISRFTPGDANIRIYRYGARKKTHNGLSRAWHYWRFYLLTLGRLFLTRPATVIYFESISAFPACIYKLFINRKARVFIHYHEYMTPQEYAGGMRLVKWFHRLEKKIYSRSSWISHTNNARMERFVHDMEGVVIPHRHILPNYPPKSWQTSPRTLSRRPVRAVYVGSLSLDTMYTREFARWVISRQGEIIWDIYSLNTTPEVVEFINSLPGGLVNLYPGIDYDRLPQVLSNYDLGVILYTGHLPNWIDNAPNKLFEYLSAGLDVWVSAVMTGSLPYVTTTTYPRVLAVDFLRLDTMDLRQSTDREGLSCSQPAWNCEEVYRPLWNELQSGSDILQPLPL